MTTQRVSAIVLAGGKSARFGRDKLAEPIDGRPLLDHAIAAVRPLASEVLVVAGPDATPALPEGVTLVRDPVAYEGPLVGLLAGLRAAREPVAIVVGGDMPTLVASVLEALVDALEDGTVDVVILEYDGRARPLPMTVRRTSALTTTGRLVASGDRRLRALTEALPTLTIPESAWRALDPEARTIRDVDIPGDLPGV
jgi:molybdenum cofactor guanylyltransferase